MSSYREERMHGDTVKMAPSAIQYLRLAMKMQGKFF